MNISEFLSYFSTTTTTTTSYAIEDILLLGNEAREAAKMAYAPYSSYKVGSSAFFLDKESRVIVKGCNVENASYPLSICAERSLISNAMIKGYTFFGIMAVTAASDDNCIPCGACRQVLMEHCGFGDDKDIWIVSVPANVSIPPEEWSIYSLKKDLLPNSFGGKNLSH